MARSWDAPEAGEIKINVHAVHYDHVFLNGNNSGLGVILRDHEGAIIHMVFGSFRNINPRANELWAMLLGLRCAFYEGQNKVILETENDEAVKEWDDWRWFEDPMHSRVVEQLNLRKKDKKFALKVSVVGASQNGIARFLAEDGATSRDGLVVFRRPSGRVRELWHLDMGLGWILDGFELLEEEEYNNGQAHQLEGEEEGMGEWLMPEDDFSLIIFQ